MGSFFTTRYRSSICRGEVFCPLISPLRRDYTRFSYSLEKEISRLFYVSRYHNLRVKEAMKIKSGKQLGYGSFNEGEERIYDVQIEKNRCNQDTL